MIRSIATLAAALALAACAPEESFDSTGVDLSFARSVDSSGDFAVTSAFPIFVAPTADGHCEIELAATFAFTGHLQGAFDAIFFIDHQGSCAEPAYEVFSADGQWNGVADGQALDFDFTFDGDIDPTRPLNETAQGTLVVHVQPYVEEQGRYELVGQAGVSGTYDGKINVFGP